MIRRQFNFYRSFYDTAKELNEKDRLQFLWALIQKEFENIEPANLSAMAKLAYASQSFLVNQQVKGWEDKNKTKLLSTPTDGGEQGGIEGPSLQMQLEVQGQLKGQLKGEYTQPSHNRIKFIPPTLDEVKRYFDDNDYKEEAAIKAFNYYSESNWHDKNGKKVKNWKQKMIGVWFKPENKKVSVSNFRPFVP